MPTVYVNDKPVEIGSRKLNCIQAAELAGVFIPSYCWHEALTVVASCRMCLVEVGTLKDGKLAMQPKVVPGCQTPVADGTVIVTGEYDKRDASLPTLPYDANYVKGGQPGERAKKAQADTLEGLLLNHPLDCPVCDKAGECKLQDFSYKYGRSETRMVDAKNTPPNKPQLSSKITLFTDRCIMCTRCVRFTREISGTSELHGDRPRAPRGDRRLPRAAAGEQAGGQRGRSVPRRRARLERLPLQAARLVPQGIERRLLGLQHRMQYPRRFQQGDRLPPSPANQPRGPGLLHVRRGAVRIPFRELTRTHRPPTDAGRSAVPPAPWSTITPQLRQVLSDAAKQNARGLVAVLSPFLTLRGSVPVRHLFQGIVPRRAARARAGSGSGRGRQISEGCQGQPD